MSLYNTLVGEHPNATWLLSLMDIDRKEIERFRDVYINYEKAMVVVFCRTGGNNREHYQQRVLCNHPNYLYDMDSETDDTFASYYFSYTDKIKDRLSKKIVANYIYTEPQHAIWKAANGIRHERLMD